jgi:prephenate dehydratase
MPKPKKSDIAVLGPENTFSDLAADSYIKTLSKKQNKYFTKDIEEVFDLVQKGSVKQGIIPIENKLTGTIRETLDNLFTKKVHIIQELNIPIHHCLFVLSHAKKSDITSIISHPQALKQCSKYLKKTFPKAKKIGVNSTSEAIEKLTAVNDKSIAAIAPFNASKNKELSIYKKNIEDDASNSTTFIVIKKSPTKPVQKNCTKISIAFHFSKDAPGSLFTIFQEFASARINMTKIESRPTRAKFGDYIFFLDFEGSISDPKVRTLLKKISKKVAKLKILGNY